MSTSKDQFLIASGIEEDGVLAGNYYDKYGSRNPIVKYLMEGFETSLTELVRESGAKTVHEVGCGEGRWTVEWASVGMTARGSDFSEQVITLARRNAEHHGVPVEFRTASIYDLKPARDAAELVVCCEVLEHLEEPEVALRVLRQLASPWLLVSVPREPIWSLMNMARGKYWSAMGNTPGHIQRWSTNAFVRLLSKKFDVVAVRQPLPWTMALCRITA